MLLQSVHPKGQFPETDILYSEKLTLNQWNSIYLNQKQWLWFKLNFGALTCGTQSLGCVNVKHLGKAVRWV